METTFLEIGPQSPGQMRDISFDASRSAGEDYVIDVHVFILPFAMCHVPTGLGDAPRCRGAAGESPSISRILMEGRGVCGGRR